MKGVLLRSAIVTSLVLLIGGCETLGTDDGTEEISPARIVDREISMREMKDIDDDIDGEAITQGLDDDSSFDVEVFDDLDDPDSPLSVRVVYFEYDSSQVQETYRAVVEAHAVYLANHPESAMTMEGHADERGSREYNLALGEQRALAVRRQMVLFGASAGQIRTVSYGEERPIVDGHDEQSYGLNRRVEIIY